MTEFDDKTIPPTPLPSGEHRKMPSTKYSDNTIPARLDMAKRETDLVLTDSEIRHLLGGYGYTQEKIDRFVVAYREAVAAQSRQRLEFGDKVGAYSDFDKIFTKAKTNFSAIRKIAKIALKDNDQKASQIVLDKRVPKIISALFDMMQTFYDNSCEDEVFCAAMAEYGFDKGKIAKYHDSFIKARDKHNLFLKEDSEAVEATRIRDDKMAILDEWMMEYYTISKIAFAERDDTDQNPPAN